MTNAKDKVDDQPTIKKAFAASRDDEKEEFVKKVKELEIALSLFLSRHSVAPTVASCMTQILKKYVPDSEIIKKMQLSHEKC
jgi:hypothetical protein